MTAYDRVPSSQNAKQCFCFHCGHAEQSIGFFPDTSLAVDHSPPRNHPPRCVAYAFDFGDDDDADDHDDVVDRKRSIEDIIAVLYAH